MKSQGCVTKMSKKSSENSLEITEVDIFFIYMFERHFCLKMLTSFEEIMWLESTILQENMLKYRVV